MDAEFVADGLLPCPYCHTVYYCTNDCRQWDLQAHAASCPGAAGAAAAHQSNLDLGFGEDAAKSIADPFESDKDDDMEDDDHTDALEASRQEVAELLKPKSSTAKTNSAITKCTACSMEERNLSKAVCCNPVHTVRMRPIAVTIVKNGIWNSTREPVKGQLKPWPRSESSVDPLSKPTTEQHRRRRLVDTNRTMENPLIYWEATVTMMMMTIEATRAIEKCARRVSWKQSLFLEDSWLALIVKMRIIVPMIVCSGIGRIMPPHAQVRLQLWRRLGSIGVQIKALAMNPMMASPLTYWEVVAAVMMMTMTRKPQRAACWIYWQLPGRKQQH